ncbi:MAG: Redox-sensing transcriptional repressor rex [Thermoanaerobacterales bacterium 50_218]|nr:MAG: Redox-sensing transcriptional repressor rex [Thermoanaerobacterales bacterium 50_218]HAA90789.1 redox-sensing transcriptional repressor Rex [Peptococcaceae bacterium]
MKTLKIPQATVLRLSLYSRFLEQVAEKGVVTVSSVEIADGVGVNPAQVRKDLAYFGEFGTRGVGYNVKELSQHIRKILGLHQVWPVVLIGAGKLGSALALYEGFQKRSFRIVGVFDNDPEKIGKKLGHLEILPLDRLAEVVEEEGSQIGIIAVPADAAQQVAERLVGVGIKAILNFSPCVLNVGEEVIVQNVDFSVNLEALTFNLQMRRTVQFR